MGKYIVGIGEVLWDLLPDDKKPGGAPANFAYHVSQFGLKGCVASAIGNDSLGKELISGFESIGLDFLLAEVDYPTGTVVVSIDEKGIPEYEITKNVAWDNIPFTSRFKNLSRNTIAVSFGSLAQRNHVSEETIYSFLADVKSQEDALIIFDVNLRQDFYDKRILHKSMEYCNVLKINDEELEVISPMFDIVNMDNKDKCRFLLEKYNLKMLILTCGINGSYIFSEDMTSYKPTPKVEVEDTVGAGDSFTAAFIASILRGKSIAESHEIAVNTSAFVCSCKGAMPKLPISLTE